jgi:molybdenum cofactor biosynthesis protein B
MAHDDHDGEQGHGPRPEGERAHRHPHRDAGSQGREKPVAGSPAKVPCEHKARAPAYARVYVITCSDTRTAETDQGGRLIRDRLAELGHVLAGSAIVRDEPALIAAELARAAQAGAQAVLVTGGTGLSKRDATFEAISAVLVRPIPGFGELFRNLSYAEIGSAAMLSRAVAGVTKDGLVVFAMPGSPGAVRLACERLIFPELTHLLEELAR